MPVTSVASSPGQNSETAPRGLLASPLWARAAGLGALATTLLLLKWTLLVPKLYESQAVVAMARSGDAVQPATLRALLAMGDKQGGETRPGAARVEALELDARHVAFVCRAPSGHAAYQRCGDVVMRSLGNKLAQGVLRPATLPAQPLHYEHGWGIWLLSCAVGLLAALGWGAGQLWWQRRNAASAPVAMRNSSPAAAERASKPPSAGAEGRASSAPRSDRPSVVGSPDEMFPDHLRTLRDRLFLLATDSCFVVGVSGNRDEGDGKAIVAGQLAWALAQSQQVEVLLLEADFDQPAVHMVMDVAMPPLAGFSQQIHQVLQANSTKPWTVVRRTASLSVLAEGRMRTPGMVYSAHFAAAISDLRNAYDIIVVSGPAAGLGAEVQAFNDVVDGVVFVLTPGEDVATMSKTAAQLFRNKRFVTVVPPPQLDG